MVDGRSRKCDGCAEVVKAGGQPWCVKTCPSNALMYGEREQILAEANSRVEALRARYPQAQIYGQTQLGGLGLIVVLPDDPEVMDLPANPQIPLAFKAWQNVVQPASLGLLGLSLAATGVAAIFARRNRQQELARLNGHSKDKKAAPVETPAQEGAPQNLEEHRERGEHPPESPRVPPKSLKSGTPPTKEETKDGH